MSSVLPASARPSNPGKHYGTVGEAEFLIEDLGTTSDCDF